jgi:hypothetical protein
VAPDFETLDPAQTDALDELALAWLTAAATSSDPEVALAAGIALSEVEGAEQLPGSMGPELARRAVAAISKVALFGGPTFHAAQKINRTHLWQVTAYVNNYDNAKNEVFERFKAVVGDETRIVLAHSLGTVVAYESIHRLGLELDLFLTTGSPLGLNTVIYPKLIPEPAFPAGVRRWVNVADREDFIAADPTLADRFPANDQRRIEDIEVANNGPFIRHHHITEYLSHDEIRRVIWEAADG